MGGAVGLGVGVRSQRCLFSLSSDVCMSYSQTGGVCVCVGDEGGGFQAESGPGGGGLTEGRGRPASTLGLDEAQC